MKLYAGIGSRSITSPLYCELLSSIAGLLEERGYVLRSGGAEGADTAFATGVQNPAMKEIFRPHHSTFEAEQIAENIHPAWENCTAAARKLHGRNVMIILGQRLNQPVEFTLYASADETRGGTQLGVNLSKQHKIPIFNLIKKEGFSDFTKYYAERIAK